MFVPSLRASLLSATQIVVEKTETIVILDSLNLQVKYSKHLFQQSR